MSKQQLTLWASEPSIVVSKYRDIEKRITVSYFLDRVTYDAPVNFNESMLRPRHRWFPFKEGFSPSFVTSFFQRHVRQPQFRILDPFSGVGTTVLEAAMNGNAGVGIEVNPLAVFIAETKALSLSTTADFETLIECFIHSSLEEIANPPLNQTVLSYFEQDYLEALLKVKQFYLSLEQGPIQDLFKLAFLHVIEFFSTHRKAGNGLKRKTRLAYSELEGAPLSQVRGAIGRILRGYLEDLKTSTSLASSRFIHGSSLEADTSDNLGRFECVLTSPPYANCFDYSKIYMCELWLGDFFDSPTAQAEFRAKSVRSHVHARWPERYTEFGSDTVNETIYPLLKQQELWSNEIPNMLRGYFMDIGRLLKALYSLLEKGSPVGIVVGNSVYGGIPIATDLLLVETAEKQGFLPEAIEVYRRIVPSSQQYVQLENKEYLRESTVVLRKA